MIRTLENIQLDGGCIVFDFTNTVNTRVRTPAVDYLKEYGDILAWSERVKLMEPKRLEHIGRCLATNLENGERAFKKAKKTRELLYTFFSAIAKGDSPDVELVKSFNVALAQAFSRIKITLEDGESKAAFVDREVSLEEPLWNIIASAYEVLMKVEHKRIMECPGCGWLFCDTSKNGKRRWCNMQACGSSDKALRYYYRNIPKK